MERPVLIKAHVPTNIHRRLKAFAAERGFKVGKAVEVILDKHLPSLTLNRRVKK